MRISAEPGDLLFYKVTPQSNWLAKLIATFQIWSGEGKGAVQYSHVSGVMNKTRHQVEASCQARARGRRETPTDGRSFDALAVERGHMTSQQATAVALAYERLRKDAERQKWAIPGYEIFSKLGEGGLGVVFKARQISMNRLVADGFGVRS